MKYYKYIIMGIIFISTNAFAGGVTGEIDKVFMGPAYGSHVVVVFSRDSVTPSCGTESDASYTFYFDSDAPGGHVTASAMLAAYTAKLNVVIQGGGSSSCSVNPNFPGAESISLLRLE